MGKPASPHAESTAEPIDRLRIGEPLARRIAESTEHLCGGTLGNLWARLGPCASDARAFAFDRFAARVLRECGADELQDAPAVTRLAVRELPTTGLAHVDVLADASDAERTLALDLESAVSRCIMAASTLEDVAKRTEAARAPHVPVSFGRVSTSAGIAAEQFAAKRRASRPVFSFSGAPAPLTAATLPEELLVAADWFSFDTAAADALAVFQCATCPNELVSILGVDARKGSDWDVRTRLAAILEHIKTPVRLDYRFDCNVEDGTAVVAFEAASTRAFPKRAVDPATGRAVDDAARTERARAAYIARMAAMLACAAFGAGLPIERANVTCFDRAQGGAAVLSCSFERGHFTRHCLDSARRGLLSLPKMRYDFRGILDLMAPIDVSFDVSSEGAFSPVKTLDAQLLDARKPLWEDRTPLGPELRSLFHARFASELDTAHYLGEEGDARRIGEARLDSADSAMAAVARLEALAARLKAELPQLADDERFLYCESPAARALAGLLDDRAKVSGQAEAYLLTGRLDAEPPAFDLRYVRFPNALFHAYAGLADLYQRMGDLTGAETLADRCIALAPTTPTGYLRKADILAERDRFSEALNVLNECLGYLALERDYALVYDRMALIFRHIGNERCALALYALIAHLHGETARHAQRVLREAARKDANAPIPRDSKAAAATARVYGVTLAPTDEARRRIARAAIGLSCAQLPVAAAPYVSYLANFAQGEGGSMALAAMAASLKYGVESHPFREANGCAGAHPAEGAAS